jgi:transcription-repair coupling factor (superfamily II helicase)
MPTSPLFEKKGSLVVDDTIGTGLLFASLFKSHPDNYVIISDNLYGAEKTYEFLLNFLKEEEVVFFPSDELLRSEAISSSRELLAQRLYAMGQLLTPTKKILVTHPAALLRFLPSSDSFKQGIITLKKGQQVNLEELKEKLLTLGYSRVNKVDQSLQFASRGDILDIFSVSALSPTRIEFFDDVVDSLRNFDIASQSSTSEIDSLTILPASDNLLSDNQLNEAASRIKKQLEEDEKTLSPSAKEMIEENVTRDLEDIVSRNYKPTLYKYYGFSLSSPYSIVSYFSPKSIFIANKEQFIQNCDILLNEAHQYYGELKADCRIISHLDEYMTLDEALPNKSIVRYGTKFLQNPDDFVFNVRPIVQNGNGISSIIPTIRSYLATCDKVVVPLAEPHQYDTVKGFIVDNKIPFSEVLDYDLPVTQLGLSRAPLNQGFEVGEAKIAYISSSELFGHRISSSRFTSRFKDATILKSYEDLRPGDYVVHEYNGIGQFLEIKTLEVDGAHRDYLHIAYAGNESLYVPLEQFRLVRKYSGREGAAPKLSHLSSGEWEKRKAHIKERVNELADRLLALYGTRAKIPGFAFPGDDEFQKKFEDEFPYTLTEDQQRSLDEIKADMEKPLIMDRLLCGDVGFGKTEVAFRAIFKAILAGKQAALLCPTTLLARQHYEVALERFSDFGIRLAIFSRLIPPSVQKSEMKAVREGKVDLIIGTHRLLSKEIVFKDLGLLVIDEEQRFGVEQKEKIKELKNTVDVLSLSATPIPRTLQMSLVGVRPLSQIGTAPANRMPIQTYVVPYKASVAQELISRELGRNGQVFYVHNRVETIYSKADELARAIPTAKIGVVHGKMEKAEIETVMEKFYDNELNVLVCTSIVENGIDIPNANLLLVEDADRFGLSQLYQIKGRVGRGDRIAYAYLFYKPNKSMNEDAQKRLQAIQEFTELGSGYKIAQRDLMIRGAGDMLGPEQAGFIDSIGLDLYLKMLNEAIDSKRTGKPIIPPKPNKMFSIDAYIPKDYAINSDKIALYQELENASSAKEVEAFGKRLRDQYGKLPPEVTLLLIKKRIDILASNSEFSSVEEGEKTIDILMSDSFSRINGVGVELFDMITPYLADLKISFLEKKLRLRLEKKEGWLSKLEKILSILHELSLRHSGT